MTLRSQIQLVTLKGENMWSQEGQNRTWAVTQNIQPCQEFNSIFAESWVNAVRLAENNHHVKVNPVTRKKWRVRLPTHLLLPLWSGELLSDAPTKKDAGRRHGRGSLLHCLIPLWAELSTFRAPKNTWRPVDNLKPWARVGLTPLFFSILFCTQHTGDQHSLSWLDSVEVTHHPRSEGEGCRWFKCFEKAHIKPRDSLAYFQHKETLLRKEKTSKWELKSYRQHYNPLKPQSGNKTQTFHFPPGLATAWIITNAGEMGAFLVRSEAPSCFSCRMLLRVRLHIQTWWDEAAVENVYQILRFRLFCSLIPCTSDKTMLQGQQVSSSSLYLFLYTVQQGTCSM